MTVIEKRRRILFFIIAPILIHALLSEWIITREQVTPELRESVGKLFDEYQLTISGDW